ncbi:hypothetical protein SLNSH_16315 [Alsobacter soli]|uniref:Glycosyl transferase family 1 domain-containing protein n=1 Tax=Alsobacter soli TaxID=2109933 RepID=A0A2T1HQR3_9HYPH|nr:glycosyltransferase [Alsobacter soli]PSC03995.1 hypothetical protein SLNSH_16315 [Alsobacter soli]
MASQQYVADFSLALLNRTGAYHVCRDIIVNLPERFSGVRYWRAVLPREPRGLVRKLMARAMIYELSHWRAKAPPKDASDRAGPPTLYLDPLYVLQARLGENDIVLCHDVGPVNTVGLFDDTTTAMYRAAYAKIQRARPGMVFVSEASRREFVACFGSDFRFLKVIPLYVRPGSDQGDLVAPAGVAKPFLLTVGALEVRKNYLRVLEAFARSGLAERGYSYVFCGPRGNNTEAIEAAAARTPGARYLGFCSDAEIRWLYRNASGFVLPSLLEGFGLPALEAAQHGLISLVSTHEVQREAVGDGAVMADPLSVEAITEGLRHLVDMPEPERRWRLEKAKAQAASLSFDRYIANWSALLSDARA